MTETKVFLLAYYKKSDKMMYVNGGKLCIGNSQISIKYFWKTVAVLDISAVQWKVLPDHTIGYKVMELSDGQQSIECLFMRKTFEKALKALEDIKREGNQNV